MGAVIECGVATRPLRGESVSGDQHLIKLLEHGALVAVVDGLGHGVLAHAAAVTAIEAIEGAADIPLEMLLKKCHARMFTTRGAAVTLASFSALDRQMRWLGVGNVEAVLIRADVRATPARHELTLRGGVVGYRLPAVRESSVLLRPGDLLLFATDGVSSEFLAHSWSSASPQVIADELLARFEKPRDDAMVLAARWIGE